MNILLLYPEMPDTFWSMKHLMKLIGKKSSYPPLGLLTVASLLPDNWNKKLIDLNVSSMTKDNLEWADLVFISAMNVQQIFAKKLIIHCKKFNSTIVAGGPLFTQEYEKFPEVDHFVLNEAEITLPLFIKDLLEGNPKKIYRTDDFPDITKSPMPNWDLVDLNKYAYAAVQYSRGCPYMCDFCDVTTLFGRKPRTKTSTQMINELNKILDSGKIDLILFADDNLIGNKRDLKNNLLPELIKWRKNNPKAPGFATQVTINLADDEIMMQQMIDAGFRNIFVGIESPDESSLENCRKTQNLKRNLLENVKKLRKFGFIVTGGFIVGFDTDNESIFNSQVNFIQESGIVIATVNILKAPPGTELHNRLQKEDRLIEPFDFDENRTNIRTNIPEDKLYAGYKYILDNIYDPKKVYKRASIFLDEYGSHRSETPIKNNVKLFKMFIFLKLIVYLGFIGEERRYFWKLFMNALKKRKGNLIHAMLFSALIYQFKKLHQKFIEVYDQLDL